MPEVIGRELQLPSFRREVQLRYRHHACVVDQDVERSIPARDERGTERGSARSSSATMAAPAMSAASRRPAAVSRTANVTSAPAVPSARAVSLPMPDEAPVTIARLPLRSIPAMTSAAVEWAPKQVVITAAGQGRRSLEKPVCGFTNTLGTKYAFTLVCELTRILSSRPPLRPAPGQEIVSRSPAREDPARLSGDSRRSRRSRQELPC